MGGNMKFCPKCGSLMRVEEIGNKKYFVCPTCKHKDKVKKEKMILGEKVLKNSKKVVVFGKGEELGQLPLTKVTCPKCENEDAYWWVQQTRSSDEPPTTFYKCKKCGYTWRSYG